MQEELNKLPEISITSLNKGASVLNGFAAVTFHRQMVEGKLSDNRLELRKVTILQLVMISYATITTKDLLLTTFGPTYV